VAAGGSIFTWRFAVLFLHIAAVIIALGGSLFSTFVLAPILAAELEPPMRLRVARQVIRRQGVIVLIALAVLVLTGIVNLEFFGRMPAALAFKLILVVIVIGLAIYQYANLGARIWRASAHGPAPELARLQVRFRRVGITIGAIVLVIVYLSLTLTRTATLALTPVIPG
jgi:uncharacterized membrane protein